MKRANESQRKAWLRDSLYNCSTDCTNTDFSQLLEFFPQLSPGQIYGRGIFVGLVGGYMASKGMLLEDALKEIKSSVHDTFDRACVPPCWLDLWDSIK